MREQRAEASSYGPASQSIFGYVTNLDKLNNEFDQSIQLLREFSYLS